MKRPSRRAAAFATLTAVAALALSACAGGSGTTEAAAAVHQQVVDSGAFVDVDISKSIEKNSNVIFAWVKVDGEMTGSQLSVIVTAVGTATAKDNGCVVEIVAKHNDANESKVHLRDAARELGLTQYLTRNDYSIEMPCRDARDFAEANG